MTPPKGKKKAHIAPADDGDGAEGAGDESISRDVIEQAIKKLIAKGKERGYVTIDELNAVLPQGKLSSEQIEDTMAMLSDIGINLVDGEDEVEDDAAAPKEIAGDDDNEFGAGNVSDEQVSRSDDPVRMYLREMGTVELLSREGEIAIAKRIEAGREMMISGICESPLTIQAILAWHDALQDGKMLLRDIIDLEATYDGEPGAMTATPKEEDLDDEEEAPEEKTEGGAESFYEEDDEAALSLAMLEDKVRPQVMETFEKVAVTYAKLFKLQAQRHAALQKGEDVSKQAEKKFDVLKGELVDVVRTHSRESLAA